MREEKSPYVFIRSRHSDGLPDDDIIPRDACARGHNAVVIELVVHRGAHSAARQSVGLLERFLLIAHPFALDVAVGAVEARAKQAAIDGRRVHDHRVLLIVARVRGDGDDGVDAGGELAKPQVLHGAGGDERGLGVVEHVGQRVHAHVEIANVHAHGLFAHGGLVGVAGRLVVVREGDDRGADAENHRGMDLAVGVGGAVDFLLCARFFLLQKTIILGH